MLHLKIQNKKTNQSLLNINIKMDEDPITSDPYDTTDGLDGWEIVLIVISGIVVFVGIAGIFLLCKKFKRREGNRQEYNKRMSKYYDSISIDENFTGINYNLFNSDSGVPSTVSTNFSTPVTPRKEVVTNGNISRDPSTISKISNGRLPSMQFRSSFSLEDTMQKLKELDQDNISQIRNSYRYYGNVDDYEEDVDDLDTSIILNMQRDSNISLAGSKGDNSSPSFRYLENDNVLVLHNFGTDFKEEVTHL